MNTAAIGWVIFMMSVGLAGSLWACWTVLTSRHLSQARIAVPAGFAFFFMLFLLLLAAGPANS